MTAAEPVSRAVPRTAREVVYRIAAEITSDRSNRIPAGDQAALRREKMGPAFWRVAVRHLEPAGILVPEDAPWRAETERRWAAIVAELARAGEQHVKGRRLGVALAEAEVAEPRVLRLARAHGESLLKTVRAVAHQLVSGGHRADWADFADLILSDGAPWEDDVRRRFCLDYYRVKDRSSRDANPEEER